MSTMKLLVAFLFAAVAFTAIGCSNEPPVTEGDAEIIKTTPKNLNPPAKALREKMGAGPSSGPLGGGQNEDLSPPKEEGSEGN